LRKKNLARERKTCWRERGEGRVRISEGGREEENNPC